MALHACKECGHQISTDAKVCPSCGKKQGASRVMGCLGAIGAVVLLGLFGSLFHHSKEANAPVPQSPPPTSQGTPGAQPPGSKGKPSEALTSFALSLQQTYRQEGFDVEVLPLEEEHTLMLRSDEFKDVGAREAVAQKLFGMRQGLCKLNVWYTQVGYSKGTLSGDIMKRVSLGCLAEKRAHLEAHKQEREQFASSVQQGLQNRYRVTVDGTTLVMESDSDFGTEANRSQFIRMFMGDVETVRKLCGIDFTQLRVEGLGQARTKNLNCP